MTHCAWHINIPARCLRCSYYTHQCSAAVSQTFKILVHNQIGIALNARFSLVTMNMAASSSTTVSASPSHIVSPLLSSISLHTSAIMEHDDLTRIWCVQEKQFIHCFNVCARLSEFSIDVQITIIQCLWVYQADDGGARGAGCWHRIQRKCDCISDTESYYDGTTNLKQTVWTDLCLLSCWCFTTHPKSHPTDQATLCDFSLSIYPNQ